MKGEAFVKMPRDLLESDAWRSLGINARRLVDFLMLEHMRHGGRKNGQLLAPRRQLEQAGIGSHYVSAAIEETVSQGLVLVKRGRGRRANIYALSWLPLFDGATPARPWSARAAKTAKQQSVQTTADQQHHMPPDSSRKARSDCRPAVAVAPNDCCSATVETAAPYKNHDLTRAGVTTLMSIGGSDGAAGREARLGGRNLPAGIPVSEPRGAA